MIQTKRMQESYDKKVKVHHAVWITDNNELHIREQESLICAFIKQGINTWLNYTDAVTAMCMHLPKI